jgi:transposase
VRVRRLLGLRFARDDGRLSLGNVAVGKEAVMEVSLRGRKDLSILRERVRKESNAKQRDRCRAVVLALEGLNEPEIRLRLGRSRGFIQRWVYAYRDKGIDGLVAKKPHGQPPKLPRDREAAFKALLDQPGAPRRGRDVAALLKAQFGATYSVRGALLLLHRLGYGPLKPRPVNPKKDPVAEAQWLEAAPFLPKTSKRNIPASPSKYGSRTKAGLAKRDA